MRLLAYVALAVLALACVLRAGCKRAVRAAIGACARAREAVVAFAAEPYMPAPCEPEPTIPPYMQARLADREAWQARQDELLATLTASAADLDKRQADLARDQAELAEQQRVEALAAAAAHAQREIESAERMWNARRARGEMPS